MKTPPDKKFILIGKQYQPAFGGLETMMRQTARLLARSGAVTIITISNSNRHKLSFWGLYAGAPKVAPYQDDDGNSVVPFSPTLLQRLLLLPISLLCIKKLANAGQGFFRQFFYFFFYAAYHWHVRKLCDHAAAIQCFEGNFLGRLACDIARERSIPFIMAPLAHPGFWGDDVFNVELYKKSDRLIVLSENEKEWFLRQGIAQQKITVTGLYPFAQQPFSIRRKYQITGPVVLYTGRREPYKGCDLLLDAWKIVHAQVPEAWIAFIGPGFLQATHAAEKVICDSTYNGIPADYSVFCMLSESETFGLVYIEAWSQSKPIVARPIPAVWELMHGQQAGVLVSGGVQELADALVQVLRDPVLGETMGKAGKILQETYYSQHSFENNLRQIYRQAGVSLNPS